MAHLPFVCQLNGRPTSDASGMSCAESCAFEDPGCIGCPNRPDGADALVGTSDPFKSSLTNGWLQGELHAPT
jgi:hypothetical protein